MNRIGIMQGRLSPATARVQEFPVTTWRQEFAYARDLGFDLIEWLVTLASIDRNPLLVDPAGARVVVLDTGVQIDSICADYLIEQPLIRVTPTDRDAAIGRLRRIVAAGGSIGIKTVTLPLLENNAAADRVELAQMLKGLRDVIVDASARGVRIAIESDLPAADVIDAIDDAGVVVCYDLGNAVAAGVDPVAELATLGRRIAVVHVKDRVKGGASVRLGEGGVPFARVFATLQAIGYDGPVILETPRGDSAVDAARAQLAFVTQLLETAALA